jgi:hypothetical protein
MVTEKFHLWVRKDTVIELMNDPIMWHAPVGPATQQDKAEECLKSGIWEQPRQHKVSISKWKPKQTNQTSKQTKIPGFKPQHWKQTYNNKKTAWEIILNKTHQFEIYFSCIVYLPKDKDSSEPLVKSCNPLQCIFVSLFSCCQQITDTFGFRCACLVLNPPHQETGKPKSVRGPNLPLCVHTHSH